MESPAKVLVSGRTEELPFEVESAWVSGWDFTVVFDDALAGRPDEELEDFHANLVAPGGVEVVLDEDRERVSEVIERAGIDYGG